MNDLDQIRKEDCRAEVLDALYHRKQGAHRFDTLHNVFLRRTDYSRTEVEDALTTLERLHLVEHAFESETSAVKVYQITGEGILNKERRKA
jgi:hypothetical protein